MTRKNKRRKIKYFKKSSEDFEGLCFTRYAWEKIVYINGLSHCEVGAFGISDTKNLLLIKDIVIVKQDVSGASVKFDDDDVADFFLDQVEAGRKPEQFGRIWIHTHPNWGGHGSNLNRIGYVGNTDIQPRVGFTDTKNIPTPSGTDEKTFSSAFGQCDWALMFIYGGGSSGYARLSLKKPFQGQIILSVEHKTTGQKPTAKNQEMWEQEFNKNVTEIVQHWPPVLYEDATQYVDIGVGIEVENRLCAAIDTDIDEESFIAFLLSRNVPVENFYFLDVASQQWWMSEFRRTFRFI